MDEMDSAIYVELGDMAPGYSEGKVMQDLGGLLICWDTDRMPRLAE